jgi:hypothetical protein
MADQGYPGASRSSTARLAPAVWAASSWLFARAQPARRELDVVVDTVRQAASASKSGFAWTLSNTCAAARPSGRHRRCSDGAEGQADLDLRHRDHPVGRVRTRRRLSGWAPTWMSCTTAAPGLDRAARPVARGRRAAGRRGHRDLWRRAAVLHAGGIRCSARTSAPECSSEASCAPSRSTPATRETTSAHSCPGRSDSSVWLEALLSLRYTDRACLSGCQPCFAPNIPIAVIPPNRSSR